ncbi:DUF1553 domain-containing protein [Aurantibacter crassamenti]|uniref:DUF1553 domain-containing protein n=1 Tax=Aurantibacter crassamenti TaxID=1837375 RepID=UPI001939BD3F|nr:DUF1553 domain-containing protein [Aurantibacter crassamenti]MBM1106643.1 DUF1553 domain-containing protein [Aurantibacter crassamenti]
MNCTRFLGLFIILMSAVSCGWNLPEDYETTYENLPEKIDFNYHVKPILSDKCFACHGPDMANQKAGLRLDIAENAYNALKDSGKHPIVPGKPEKSEVVSRILSNDSDLQMPPLAFKVELTKIEKAILIKWIEQGAEYKPHWSFIKPEKVQVAKVESNEWVKNEIDQFVVAKLKQNKLEPSKTASKENLIRRLSFSLNGLPPTLEQIEDFVADKSSNAYENLVDKLLGSNAYGERMAADWLDVARYADSDGYLDDKHRDFSPYRDWVINAFNKNMPYDQFTTWQLAGDLIENPTQESILATAFNRLHKKNSEAGITYEEYRVEYVADRTLAVGKAFMGLSMECARCHDHKYDPISQKDHYKLFAFFNSTNEIGTAVYGPGQVPGPSLLLTTDEQNKVLDFIDHEINVHEKQLISVEKESELVRSWLADVSKIENSLKSSFQKGLKASLNFDTFLPSEIGWLQTPDKGGNKVAAQVKEPDIKVGVDGNAVFFNDFTVVRLAEKTGWFDQTDPFTISTSIFPDINYEEAAVFTHCEETRQGLKGYSLHLENNHLKFIIARSWPSNAIQIKTKNSIPEKEWSNVAITYDGLGKADGVKIFLNGKEVPVVIEIDNLYKSILFKKNAHNYAFNGFTMGLRGMFKTFKNGGIDNLNIYDRKLSELEILYNFAPKEAMQIVNDEKNKQTLVDFYYTSIDENSEQLRQKLKKLRSEKIQKLEPIKEIMVLGDLPEPRPTYVLDRGMYDSPTDEVKPGVPEAILPFSDSLPQNRLGLSKWLFDKDNPLTARVFVNRLWQMHFGRGLVETSDDFGNQGSLPSHPKLLDWLAIRFIESGWDIKAINKLIVMSATYQQSSEIRPELLELDTENVLLARGPSLRMTAEMVRDNALAISGLLSTKIGGASTYPYQPDGLWDEISNKSWRYRYLQEPGEGLYSRSLYTIWKRSSAPPSMQIFDAGDRSICTVKRRQTSTPLQALVLLNDPQYIEAAYVLAENLINNTSNEVEMQLKNAFKLSTGRLPKNKELKVLNSFYEDELKRFSANKKDAIAYLGMGETKIQNSSDPIKVAALATVINGIMNTSEGYTIR